MTTATIATTAAVSSMTVRHCSIMEAARILKVSQTTIRRSMRQAGVRKVCGQHIAGFALFASATVPVAVAFAE